MKHLTVRNVPDELAAAIEAEQTRRGASLNQTVLTLLRRALGLEPDRPFDNGLGRFAGTWSEDELREFEAATAQFEEVDPELWR